MQPHGMPRAVSGPCLNQLASGGGQLLQGTQAAQAMLPLQYSSVRLPTGGSGMRAGQHALSLMPQLLAGIPVTAKLHQPSQLSRSSGMCSGSMDGGSGL